MMMNRLPEVPPVAHELLAHLHEDAARAPLRVRDEDRPRAVQYVHELLFAAAKSHAHFDHLERVPSAPTLPRVALPRERAEVIVATGLDELTNEELAHLLLVRRAVDELSVLLCTRCPEWSFAEFAAIGAALVAKYEAKPPAPARAAG
jgi:hypothetical protein